MCILINKNMAFNMSYCGHREDNFASENMMDAPDPKRFNVRHTLPHLIKLLNNLIPETTFIPPPSTSFISFYHTTT